MANMKTVNYHIKNHFPDLDIELVKGDGYFYFDGKDGFDKVNSIFSNPSTTSTSDITFMAISEIEDVYPKC